jgi:hypothetical protein
MGQRVDRSFSTLHPPRGMELSQKNSGNDRQRVLLDCIRYLAASKKGWPRERSRGHPELELALSPYLI